MGALCDPVVSITLTCFECGYQTYMYGDDIDKVVEEAKIEHIFHLHSHHLESTEDEP